jgi:hypothetical protein
MPDENRLRRLLAERIGCSPIDRHFDAIYTAIDSDTKRRAIREDAPTFSTLTHAGSGK